jgi:putative methyltransferase (TIGR04325 family)
MNADEPIWSGVFGSFSEVRGAPVFEQTTWLEKASTFARDRLTALGTPCPVLRRDDGLPLLAATLARPRTILDFGGGVGAIWADLHAGLGEDGFRLDVVETAPICDAGRALFAGRSSIAFHESIPDRDFQLVHSRSALHYVEDWRGMIRTLCARAEALLVLADLPVGPVETFVTAQRFYGRDIPVWFWNDAELIAAVTDQGFELTFRAHRLATIRGVEGPLPMWGLPADRRLTHTQDLVFRRSADVRP